MSTELVRAGLGNTEGRRTGCCGNPLLCPPPWLLQCLLLFLFLCMALTGCGTRQTGDAAPDASPARMDSTVSKNMDTSSSGPLLRYTADFTYAEPDATGAATQAAAGPAAGATATRPAAPPADLMAALRGASLLLKLRDTPPDDMQGLDFRIDKDEAEARRLLQAFGHYEGSVQRRLTPPEEGAASPQWKVNLVLTPGPRYTVGETVVRYAVPPSPAADSSTAASAGPPKNSPQNSPDILLPEGAAPPDAPATLADAGLAPGSPAEAARVLRAVERLPELLARRGYPLAKVGTTRYAVDKGTRQLFATVLVHSGPRVRMGQVRVQGESHVKPEYLEKLRQWQRGELWDQQQVEEYRDLLTRQGLFRSIDMQPVPDAATDSMTGHVTDTMTAVKNSNSAASSHAATPDATASASPASSSERASSLTPDQAPDQASEPVPPLPPALAVQPGLPRSSGVDAGKRPANTGASLPIYDLLVSVADAPQRTVGGGLNYESNRGPGVQAYWEHRNLLGQGERFRAETSLWQDTQFARATFRKPAFLDRAQEFTAEGWLRNEDTEAYTQRAAALAAGVDRRLWGPLFVSAGLGLEGGDLKDPTHPRRGYTMTSLPLQARYEGAGGAAQLDPVRGWRGTLGVRPTWGYYDGGFTVTPTRLTLSGYYPLWRMPRGDGSPAAASDGKSGDAEGDIWRVVLAARGAAGTLWRGDSQRVPASIRYYGGGGGSVRGYAYQSLGPRDVHGDPLGGSSFAELSLEARIRITEDISIVPFLDGGNVFSGCTPGFERDGRATGLQWGAGLGLRYHTVVGPLRLDVATPVNPRKDDGPVFLYISIGQSF